MSADRLGNHRLRLFHTRGRLFVWDPAHPQDPECPVHSSVCETSKHFNIRAFLSTVWTQITQEKNNLWFPRQNKLRRPPMNPLGESWTGRNFHRGWTIPGGISITTLSNETIEHRHRNIGHFYLGGTIGTDTSTSSSETLGHRHRNIGHFYLGGTIGKDTSTSSSEA